MNKEGNINFFKIILLAFNIFNPVSFLFVKAPLNLLFDMILSCMYPTPLPWARCDTKSILRWITDGLNLKFSFSKAKEPSLPNYLPI